MGRFCIPSPPLKRTRVVRGKKQGGWELQGATEPPSDVGQSAACWSLSSPDSFPPAEDTVCHAGGVGAGTWSQRRCRWSVCKAHPSCVLPKLPEDVFWERLPVDCRGAFKFGKRNQINRWLCRETERKQKTKMCPTTIQK